jgi:hypothetical protein
VVFSFPIIDVHVAQPPSAVAFSTLTFAVLRVSASPR